MSLNRTISTATLLTLAAGLTIARADVIQSTVILPPPAGSYTFSTFCLSAAPDRCVVDPTVSDFSNYSETEVAGNELVTVDADYMAELYTNNSGVPGTLLGQLSLTGTMDITYFNRNTGINPLGTFSAQITAFDFKGMFNGNTFQVVQDPTHPSTGMTTILQVSPVKPSAPLYDVSSYFDVYGDYSFNGGPFTPAPERTATLVPIPEPASGALAAVILSGILGAALRRRRKA